MRVALRIGVPQSSVSPNMHWCSVTISHSKGRSPCQRSKSMIGPAFHARLVRGFSPMPTCPPSA
eukprot:5575469-Pyramimonas_sp.AAC.1